MSDHLKEAHVRLLYPALLGRDAGLADVDHHVAHSRTVGEFLEILLASEEYAARNPTACSASEPLLANLWHPDLAEWTHPVGSRSADDVAIVGREGWVFLRGGSNKFVPQFSGALQMEHDWLGRWQDLIAQRRREADALGVHVASLVVPEKMAIMLEQYPEPLIPVGPRPIERLLEAGLPIGYPLQALRTAAAEDPVCLRTDSHLTIRGNAVLNAGLLAELGAAPIVLDELPASRSYVSSGDLGSRFAPRVLEVTSTTASLGIAELVEDNWADITRAGGHIGTRRVFRSPGAPDPRTVILFGDSYGFAAESYQGTAWFLAQAFRETHFVWAPFGWDPGYVEQVGADVVVSETAERFVARVPMDRVDVSALAAEAEAKGTFVAVDDTFADVPHSDLA